MPTSPAVRLRKRIVSLLEAVDALAGVVEELPASGEVPVSVHRLLVPRLWEIEVAKADLMRELASPVESLLSASPNDTVPTPVVLPDS